MNKILLTLLLIGNISLYAQRKADPVKASPADSMLSSSYKWRCVGPARGGRSGAVAGVLKETNTFYFGATGGGVFKTTDGGSNWSPISDKYFGGSIGAVSIANSDRDIIWVGEGEQTMRGNVSEGHGIWKSVDGGNTWKNMGLTDSRHIVRIRIHPKNPDVVYVCAFGHLFGKNNERGIYKTIDGGNTWKRILFLNDSVAASDLVMDPVNPSILYASFWNVKRTPYSLESGGPGSSLWKTTDGGATWTDITQNEGMPKGPLGIITVSVSPVNTDKIFAMVEAAEGGLMRSDDGGTTWIRVNDERKIRQRAWYFSRVYADTKDENVVYVLNVAFHRSGDGGKTFKTISTPHGDHHDLWIDPDNNKRMIVADDGGAQVTFDGGENWSTYYNQPTAQFYRVSTDNHFPYRIYGAQQDNSSLRIHHRSFTSGSITQEDWEPTAGFESGHIVPDPLNDDIVYGGNYDGFIGRLNHKTGENNNISVWPDANIGRGADSARYRFQWNFPLFFSPHEKKRLYAAANVLFCTEDEGISWKQISPDLTRDDKSKQKASGGIITKDNTGVETYATIFAACESPYEKDLLWCGSDDGLMHVSRDGGKNWSNVTPKGMPEWMMFNCLEPDPFTKGGLYAVGTRYKLDDYTPYIYYTNNYGATWTKITNGITSDHFTRCLRADPYQKGILYCGTEYGMYLSNDAGKSWKKWQLNLPMVPITDLAIKDYDLIAATQGRSFWVLDDLSLLHQWNETLINKKFHLFQPRTTWCIQSSKNEKKKVGENPAPGLPVTFYFQQKPDSNTLARMEFLDESNKVIKSFYSNTDKDSIKLKIKRGMNTMSWDMRYPDAEKIDGIIMWNDGLSGPLAPPGKYSVKLVVGQDSILQTFQLRKPGNVSASDADLKEQFDLAMKIRDKISAVHKAIGNIRSIRSQLNASVEKAGKDSSLKKMLRTEKDTIDKKITAIEEALYQTKLKANQDILNYPIQLNDKLAGVYDIVNSGSTKPTKQSYQVFEQLALKADHQLNLLKQMLNTDVKKFNELMISNKVPVIFVKE